MMPGYSGHVPRLRDQLAAPFGTATAEAISHFDKHRVQAQSRTRLSRSAPALQAVKGNRRDVASPETLAFEANANANSTSHDAPFTQRTVYSRRAGAMAGTTKHVPFREHTSIGRTFQEATKESAKMLRASRPGSHYSSSDMTLTQIAK